MSEWGFYFDQTRCIGCKTCTAACMAWNEEKRGDAELYPEEEIPNRPEFQIPAGYEKPDGSKDTELLRRYTMKEELIRVHEDEYGPGMPDVDILPLALPCGQCRKPACAEVCPVKAIARDEETGVLTVDRDSCIGCGRCAEACPFGAPQFWRDPKTAPAGEKPKMLKCDFCLDRIKAGLKPACVAACRVRALDALPLDELHRKYPETAEAVLNLPDDRSPVTGQSVGPKFLFRPKKLRNSYEKR